MRELLDFLVSYYRFWQDISTSTKFWHLTETSCNFKGHRCFSSFKNGNTQLFEGNIDLHAAKDRLQLSGLVLFARHYDTTTDASINTCTPNYLKITPLVLQPNGFTSLIWQIPLRSMILEMGRATNMKCYSNTSEIKIIQAQERTNQAIVYSSAIVMKHIRTANKD